LSINFPLPTFGIDNNKDALNKESGNKETNEIRKED